MNPQLNSRQTAMLTRNIVGVAALYQTTDGMYTIFLIPPNAQIVCL